jgi:50S ribosomal protein L16 3-hydroxylase
MRRHWQRRPVLVRNAFPGFVSPVTPSTLFELAARDDVESRVVSAFGGRWQLRHGPFDADALPSHSRRRWTLLVQGVDTLLDEVHALLSRFRFVADARLDDLMISWASDGGGVGPHLDSYDVFLLQAHGRRRWRIGPATSAELVPGLPLKILSRFEPDEEWVLEPGDMLYLPPGWAHDGVAVGECMTFSVGFRAPSRHELIRAWLAEQADATPAGPDPRFSDPGVAATRHPGAVPAGMHATLARWIRSWRPRGADVDAFIGRFLTEPKASVWFDAPARVPAPQPFAARADRLGLRADRRTRMSYRGSRFFVNGECYAVAHDARALLQRLADERRLPPGALRGAPVDSPLIRCLHECFDAGWIRFDATSAGRAGRARPRR